MVVDHAFTLPMALLWPDQKWPVRVVPVCINTVQSPLPSAARCYKLGEAIGRAVRSWDSDANVLILGTGGLSHARRRGGQGAPQLPHPDLEHGRRSGGHRSNGLSGGRCAAPRLCRRGGNTAHTRGRRQGFGP